MGDLAAATSTLEPDERAHALRFVHPDDRSAYVVGHGLLRSVLSGYLGVPPAALRFVRSAWGRPELVGTPGSSALRFSLSHKRGLVGCAVTIGADVGFDLEFPRRPAPLEIAQRFFHPSEHAALTALPPHEQVDRFCILWTAKEACTKALGLGLSYPLDSFAVDVRSNPTGGRADDSPAEARLVWPTSLDPDSWMLRCWRASDHWATVALRRPHGSAMDLERYFQDHFEPTRSDSNGPPATLPIEEAIVPWPR